METSPPSSPPKYDPIDEVLLELPFCTVHKPGPRTSTGYRAEEFKEVIWYGACVVVRRLYHRDESCLIKLVDRVSGALFAECPVPNDNTSGTVARAVDSSRYFVLKLDNGEGRHAFVGLGFKDRNSAFDFNEAICRFGRDEASCKPINLRDLQLKEGEKIKLTYPAAAHVCASEAKGGQVLSLVDDLGRIQKPQSSTRVRRSGAARGSPTASGQRQPIIQRVDGNATGKAEGQSQLESLRHRRIASVDDSAGSSRPLDYSPGALSPPVLSPRDWRPPSHPGDPPPSPLRTPTAALPPGFPLLTSPSEAHTCLHGYNDGQDGHVSAAVAVVTVNPRGADDSPQTTTCCSNPARRAAGCRAGERSRMLASKNDFLHADTWEESSSSSFEDSPPLQVPAGT